MLGESLVQLAGLLPVRAVIRQHGHRDACFAQLCTPWPATTGLGVGDGNYDLGNARLDEGNGYMEECAPSGSMGSRVT